MYCLKCNEWHQEGSTICKNCGEKLSSDLEYYVRRYMDGDETVFANIYQLSCQHIIYTIYKYSDIPADVEGYVQEIYVQLLNQIQSYDAEQISFITWAKEIANGFMLEEIKRIEQEGEPVQIKDISAIEDQIIQEIDTHINPNIHDVVNVLLNALKRKEKQCLMMYFMDGMKTKEIAKRLHVSEGRMRTRLKGAKEALQKKAYTLEKQGIKIYGVSPVYLYLSFIKKDIFHEIVLSTVSPTAGDAVAIRQEEKQSIGLQFISRFITKEKRI